MYRPMPVHMGLQHYAASKIGAKNVAEFCKWAFGQEFHREMALSDIPKLWNANHKSLMEVSADDKAVESFDKMLNLYVANVMG